jgi:separase
LHESSELFIFCGHGAGERMHDTFRLRKFRSCPASLLWGCSSGRLKARGVHDALGTALYYLMAGAPFLVANLWDVTDKDIDKLCMAHMERIFAPVSESASGGAEATGGNGQAAVALAQCRDVCRMPYAVGAAPVFYGIPALLCAVGKC